MKYMIGHKLLNIIIFFKIIALNMFLYSIWFTAVRLNNYVICDLHINTEKNGILLLEDAWISGYDIYVWCKL